MAYPNSVGPGRVLGIGDVGGGSDSSYWQNFNSDLGKYRAGTNAMAMPSGWSDYLAAGGNPNDQTGYKNWALQNQRNLGLSSFVNNMADPNSVNTAGFNADLGHARGDLNAFLKTNPADAFNPFTSQVSSYQKRLSDLLDNPGSIQNSAAYKFRFDQGLDALNRQLGAKGLLNSGNRLIDTTNYGQNAASQEYDNQFKRLSDVYGTNAQGYIGAENANTNQWQAQGNVLNNYYNNATGAVNQNAQISNNNRLGWADVYAKNSPSPQGWSITNTATRL